MGLREYIEKIQSADDGWRIKWIAHKDDPLEVIKPNPIILVFIAGFIGFLILPTQSHKDWPEALAYFQQWPQWAWVVCAVVCFVLALLTMLVEARAKRRHWKRIRAKVLDREVRKESDGDGKSWQFRLLCEFRMDDGKTYQATPWYWRTFATKVGVNHFLDKKISPDGYCELHVNSRNPLQTEFAGSAFYNWLLY